MFSISCMSSYVEGHTSAESNADLNMKLSEESAQTVADILVDYEGLDARRLEVVGCCSQT